MWIVIVGVLLVSGIMVGEVMSNVETPAYEVISTPQKGIEIRRYAPMLIAEVQLSGEREQAIRAGFKILADYIFGNNVLEQKIAMTAPVAQQGVKIAMTAPVTQQSVKIAMTAPVAQQAVGEQWRVSFVLPAQYTLETLPKPQNPEVKIIAVASQRFAVIRFSGRQTQHNLDSHQKQLEQFLQQQQLQAIAPAKYAFYNPPWTLPPLRRNEVMMQLAAVE